MKTISFIVLEDDPKFRNELIAELNATDGCEVIGASDNVSEGYEQIIRLKPDALILDIELFGGTAFDLVRMMKTNGEEVPPIVIITANVVFEAASEALDVCGSALVKLIGKPFWKNWEAEFPAIKAAIVSRLQKRESEDANAGLSVSPTKDVLYIRSSQVTHRIKTDNILYLEVMGEGQTTIVMNDHRQVPVRKTLTVLMGLLPDHICQISRFNAINIHRLLHINHEDDTLILDGYPKPLTIGEKYKDYLRGMFS